MVTIAVSVELTNNVPTTMCKRIKSRLPGRISYPGDPVYTNSLSSYYSEQERELDPSCVFTPTSTADVSRFLKLMAKDYDDRSSVTRFAVRSGGHQYFAGAANIDGGITIDMRGMRDLTFNHDFTVASIGGGAIWSEDVYPYLVAHNRTAAGARLPGIGIGGFVTGGRRNGFACDNVVGYEVVLASGEVVKATASSAAEINYSFKNSVAAVYSELFQIYNDTLPELMNKNIPGAGVQWLIQPQAVTNGTNSLGLAPNVTDLVSVDIVVGWNNTADDDFMSAFLNTLTDKHVEVLTKRGVHIPFIHLNYAGKSQDPIGSYDHDGDIKKHFQAISKKYDPNGVFQTKVPGGFKLFT
ncbi:hypothetical protein DL766_007475 [Monosporascus sp. MC13-8B]|uniref:FAD-binding PCMH-type domain-containing protein n=1 Tax=Monosporascus cannonballus TaxID=155416 RepID=A0ABY0HK20_9PEZI|nr:hypothetical protein DL763_010677 [Monosporascus cannonballus]RYO94889.1 hypothetical protein DL762_000323 [Monosporascus cannonballus]RYP23641.1 hypothetical protein DL766_007475 [Monosporascus sp. MC13-8B]